MHAVEKRVLILLLITFIFLPLLSSASLGTFRQNDCIPLHQTCSNCSYVNLTTISYPNATIQNINAVMTKSGTDYNYTFCSTSLLGTYSYNTLGDLNGNSAIELINFSVTEGGDTFDISQSIIILGQMGFIILLIVISFSFNNDKWKIKMFFHIMAMIMGIILLNSIRILMGTSNSLEKMGSYGLITGIIILLFMITYMLILYTIQVFNYFKEKRRMKWQISDQY